MGVCPECGTDKPYPGLKWYVRGPNSGRFCSTCHATESQWPTNVTTEAVRNYSWVQECASGRNDTNRPAPHPGCGHMCARIPEQMYIQYYAGCCSCVGRSHTCSQCYPRKIAQSLVNSGTPRHQAERIQSEILTGTSGNQIQESSGISTAPDRRERIHQAEPEAPRATVNERLEGTPQTPAERTDVRTEQRMCVVCQEREKSVVLMPCRHLCLCDGCSTHDMLRTCPLCRVPIAQKISVFS